MSHVFFIFALPAVAFLTLVLWPKGRPALRASLIAAALLVAAWAAAYFGLWTAHSRGDNDRQVFAFFSLLGFSLAWFLASSLQVLRLRFPTDWPRWSWPAVGVSTLGIVGLAIYRMIGL